MLLLQHISNISNRKLGVLDMSSEIRIKILKLLTTFSYLSAKQYPLSSILSIFCNRLQKRRLVEFQNFQVFNFIYKLTHYKWKYVTINRNHTQKDVLWIMHWHITDELQRICSDIRNTANHNLYSKKICLQAWWFILKSIKKDTWLELKI